MRRKERSWLAKIVDNRKRSRMPGMNTFNLELLAKKAKFDSDHMSLSAAVWILSFLVE